MSEPLDRLRKAWKAKVTEHIRYELRNGATIASAMASTGATKRQVEEQRAFLKQTEGLADTRRNGTRSEVMRLTAAGLGADEIAAALRLSTSSVYHHRRQSKKV